MIELRRFRNSDSPGIASVWSSQPPLRGRLPRLTSSILEQHVLSKPYFDPRDLIVAADERRVIGFVHVGFLPSVEVAQVRRQEGIVCQLQVLPGPDRLEIASRLFESAVMRLQETGARTLLAGGIGIHAPFYLGLYGGSQLPGVLTDDTLLNEVARRANFAEFRPVSIWQRELSGFRPPIDRDVIALRRQYQIHRSDDYVAKDWRDACAFGWTEPLLVKLVSPSSRTEFATLMFWDCEPLASSWGARCLGLASVSYHAESLSLPLLTFFLAETMRQLLTQGIAIVEVQTESADRELIEVCGRLAFREVDRGMQLRKEVA